ncbi:major facilitator superfamily domain-containing protein 6 isoform X2 [Hyalella azteca]|uniref:Major facilitator superfamily domain-containing protein 6 isoform X2 n=1 Tax=Hyalella azteca TaxID=294128 RepID=A0A8B7PSV3_HYAAZ|nr:major facilitator superfamily domain-containing protein 6 isoform X2 [Hyalella azteca]
MNQGYAQPTYYDDGQAQDTGMPVPRGQVSRPYVDPNATGEVDPNQYPEPKEATHKIRGRSDFLDMVCKGANHELIFAKSFYFFFFSAFGSLFPLMAVYFKQMAMSGGQTGFLIGCRPFVEFLACPFWGSLADKFRKGKIMLLAAVLSWIIFTVSVGLVQPPAIACVKDNGTHEILFRAFSNESHKASLYGYNDLDEKGKVGRVPASEEEEQEEDTSLLNRMRKLNFWPPNHIVGKSPIVLNHVANYEEFGNAKDWISPPFSSIVYHQQDVQKVFFLLLLLVMLGEFFSSPAITLTDHAVLSYLGEEAEQYGKQRMFGSLGWGLAMFVVGIALDQSVSFPGHPCAPHPRERNYYICFTIFSVLMFCAMLVATQFKFDYSSMDDDAMNMEEVKPKSDEYEGAPRPWNEPKIPMQQTKTGREKLEEVVGTLKTRVFAQTVRERPQWMLVLREFKTLRCSAFLFVAWWMGCGIGLIFAFLFWHLQDYGGTPTLFGIASILNHISEIGAYFLSFRLIAEVGHVKVLCIGLAANVLRFLYISYMENPWWVIPFELIQGVTHATVWAACCSYLSHNTPAHLRHHAQGVLQGIHHGIGRGCGAIIGGLFVNAYGTTKVFFGYGLLSLLVLGVFVFVNFYRREGGFQPDVPPEEDPRQMADEGAALAPHGVPANPIPRAHSTQHLDKTEGNTYGSCTTNGMLDVQGNQGGSTNPFGQSEGYGGAGGGGGYNYSMQSDVAPQDEEPSSITGTNPFKKADNVSTISRLSEPDVGAVTGEPEWPFCREEGPTISPTSPNSPTDIAPHNAIRQQFKAYDELVASTVNGKPGMTKHFMESEVEGVIKPQSLIY